MVLTFTELTNLKAGVSAIQLGHEPNNELVEYYLEGNHVRNEIGYPDEGDYSEVTFGPLTNRVPSKSYSKFGIKTFPKIGAYGWFRSRYENITNILVPLRVISTRYAPPTFTFTQTTNTVQVTLASPGSITYDCYRVLFRNEYEAIEYITYNTFLEVEKPPSATYELYAVGYKTSGEVSEESPRQEIVVVNPNPVPDPLGDVVYSVNSQIADINGNVLVGSEDIGFSDEDFSATNVKGALIELGDGPDTLTLTLLAAGWVSLNQAVSAPGVTATNTIIVAPVPASQSAYVAAGVICLTQADGSLTFACATEPVVDIVVGVVIM